MRNLIFLCLLTCLCGAEQIQLGDQVLTVEVARTDEERAKGLSGRDELQDGQGMLFLFKRPRMLGFWMKNTQIPLSIGFFNEKRELINTLDMTPAPAPPYKLYRSRAPALYALEVPQGWFEKHQIGQGAKFSFLDPQNEVYSP